MKTSNFTQDELRKYYESGRTVLVQYRTVYLVEYSHGCSGYIVRKHGMVGQPSDPVGWTRKGRFIAYTPEDFHTQVLGYYAKKEQSNA